MKHMMMRAVCGLLGMALATPSFAAIGSAPADVAGLVARALETSPEMAAADAAIQAASERLAGAGLPLNNPELEAEAERSDVNTFRLGVSQTIDWYDKRAAFEAVARARLALARQSREALAQEKARGLLQALGRAATLDDTLALARERVSLLGRVARLAARRHAAGDLSQVDLQLAQLAQAEARIQVARIASELIQARADFQQVAGFPLDDPPALPGRFGEPFPSEQDDDRLARHPAMQAALLEARIAGQEIQRADRERRADPTVGLAGGREGDQNLLGLSLSLPLQVRNDFSAEVRATRAEALQAEQQAHQTRLNLGTRLAAERARYLALSDAWKTWQKTGQRNLERRLAALERLWRAGEIGTSDYLLQLQQTLDTRIAGVELRGDLWNAWIDWLAASGTLNDWLNAPN